MLVPECDLVVDSLRGQLTNSSLGCSSTRAKLLVPDQQANEVGTGSGPRSATSAHDATWRYKYIDEQTDKFDLLIQDESIDERLANVIHTATSNRIVILDTFKFHSGDRRQDEANKQLVAGPHVDDELCGKHLGQMVGLVDELSRKLARKRQDRNSSLQLEEKHIRLARVLDSFGRYESGHLIGRTHSSGSFDQCTGSELILANTRVGARFCWARLNLNKHLNVALRMRKLNEFEAQEQLIFTGICIPNSCHSKSFEKNAKLFQQLVDSQFKLPANIYIDENLELESIYCTIDENSSYGIPLNGKLFIILMVSWLLLTIYATKSLSSPSSANYLKQHKLEPFLKCLDIKENWQDFICDTNEPDRRDKINLDVLNPVKVLGCAFVVLGHSLIFQIAPTMDSIRSYRSLENDPVLLLNMVGTVVVDTFFVVTGTLLTYITMAKANEQKRPKSNGQTPDSTKLANAEFEYFQQKTAKTSLIGTFFKQWFRFVLTRYLRLVPLFFLVFWFKKSVFIYMFSGLPFWDDGFNKDTEIGSCKRESWLTPFTAMSAFLPLAKQCLPQSWSISSDLFFSLTIGPIILIMTKKPKLAFILTILICSSSLSWGQRAFNQSDPVLINELKEIRGHGFTFMFGSLSHLYTYPHFRFCSVMVGVVCGYLLFKYNQSDDLKDWPQWLKGPATKLAFLVLLATFVVATQVPDLKQLLNPYHRKLVVHMITTLRLIWSLSNGVLFLRMATDWKQNYLMQMASARFWRSFVKLNFVILLIHLDYLMLELGTQMTTSIFTKFKVISTFGATYLFCVLTGIVVHVLIENPIDKLIKRHVLPVIKQITK